MANGFRLAATLHRDEGRAWQQLSAPLRKSLSPLPRSCEATVAAASRALAPPEVTRELVQRLPPAVAALFCGEVEKELGRELLLAAPRIRKGFRPNQRLRRWLLNIAAEHNYRGTAMDAVAEVRDGLK